MIAAIVGTEDACKTLPRAGESRPAGEGKVLREERPLRLGRLIGTADALTRRHIRPGRTERKRNIMIQTKKRAAALAVAALAAGSLALLGSCGKGKESSQAESYEFTTIAKGSIESTVTSTGTLAVDSSVDVLAQMSGRIEKVYVDYNSSVKKGELLATINTDLLKLEAKAAQANVDKYRSNYELQELSVQNSRTLYEKGLLSEYDYKTALSTLNVNRAELASAMAALEEIETEINQYAFVKSPIDGVVLSKDVDAGSSVVGGSSSNTTTLFTLAGDLSKMQILAEVDELDIGSIHSGQDVRFTVEANPGMTFSGAVKEVRLVPESSDNLVYYYVNILADNRSAKLLPGMTANVTFIKQKKDDILVVPSAALRFSPASLGDAEKARILFIAGLPENLSREEKDARLARYDEAAKAQASSESKSGGSSGISGIMGGAGGFGGNPMMRGPGGGGEWNGNRNASAQASSPSGTAVLKPLWYIDESGDLAAVLVEVGISDSKSTEISGAGAMEGKKVILKVKA